MTEIRAWAAALFGVGAAALITAGCDKQVPQRILVNVAGWNSPPAVVRLHEASACTGTYREAARSAELTFTFDTTSTQGRIGVVTQDLTLCYSVGADWRPLWSSRHGGGAKQIIVRCDGATSCTDEFDYQ